MKIITINSKDYNLVAGEAGEEGCKHCAFNEDDASCQDGRTVACIGYYGYWEEITE